MCARRAHGHGLVRTGIGRVEDESASDAEPYCPNEDVYKVSETNSAKPKTRDVVRAAAKGGSEGIPHTMVLGSKRLSAADSPRRARDTRDQLR
jgi:hypothetical protein